MSIAGSAQADCVIVRRGDVVTPSANHVAAVPKRKEENVPQECSAVAAAIDAFANRVQAVDPLCLWLYETDHITLALALGSSPDLRERSGQLVKALRVLGRVGLAAPLVKLGSALLLFRMLLKSWRYQWRQPRKPALLVDGIFVSIGALREPVALADFTERVGGNVVILDERFPERTAWGRWISVGDAWQLWDRSLTSIFQAWRRGELIGLSKELFLLNVLRLLHLKTYYGAGILALTKASTRAAKALQVACVAPSLPGFAATEIGCGTMFYQHGFLRRSLVFPHFDEIIALDMPEGIHVRSRMPNARVRLLEPSWNLAGTTTTLTFSGVYSDVKEADEVKDLIAVCVRLGVKVVVRPHPRDVSGYWNVWRGTDGVCFDTEGTFDEFLERHRPRVVASWSSTSLFDGLTQGAVPLNIGEISADLVFPLREVALQWPDDRDVLPRVFLEPDFASAFVAQRRAILVGNQMSQSGTSRMLDASPLQPG